MRGWLVTNRYLGGNKFAELTRMLLAAAAELDVELENRDNASLAPLFTPNPAAGLDLPDFVLFWDKDTRLARLLEAAGLRLYNSSSAIALCDDKMRTCAALAQVRLPQPRTCAVPLDFGFADWRSDRFPAEVCAALGDTVVIKECFGSFGEQVYIAHGSREVAERLASLKGRPALVQEFVASAHGSDLRVEVAGGRVIAAMRRTAAPGEFRANVTHGGSMAPAEPTSEEAQIAIAACRVLKLDFAGVDLLTGEDGKPLICEVNSNAHLVNISKCSGINAAKLILESIVSQEAVR
ncbi:MAG: RimK family alpha-L-glutamate ligase [Victivallaceae bacterium]|nr:RimK family alpha-L-glutamate ligase [Victivallaceae bacterium]